MSSQETMDFGVLLNLAFASFRQRLDESLLADGFDDLGPSYGYVFRRVQGDGCSLSQLARHLSITPPGALKLVDEMVERGYIQRVPDLEDSRVKRIQLTERGRLVVQKAREFHREYEHALGERMGPDAVAATRSVLEAIVENSPPGRTAALPRPS